MAFALTDVAVGEDVTVNVKACVASIRVLLLAVMVKLCVPAAVVAVMVISPLVLLMVTPAGAPVSAYAIGVVPVAVTVNVPPAPLTTDVLLAEVITGGAVTVSVKVSVALGVTPLAAPSTTIYSPAVSPAAISRRCVVPFQVILAWPEVLDMVAVGTPVAV